MPEQEQPPPLAQEPQLLEVKDLPPEAPRWLRRKVEEQIRDRQQFNEVVAQGVEAKHRMEMLVETRLDLARWALGSGLEPTARVARRILLERKLIPRQPGE